MSVRNCSVSVTVAVAVARTLAVCRVAISAWIISRNCSISVTVAVTGGLPVRKYASACCMISVGEQRLFAARSFNTILRTFFERKGLTNEATTWLNVVIASHSHFNWCMAYDNGQRHPETHARARSTTAEV